MAHVLVVDDDSTVREVVATYLRANNHDVTEAGDGEAAIAAVARNPCDLIVLDLMLPGVDGLEVCRRVRKAREIPIIMLTALGSETDRVVGLELGADDYVTKPFSPRELALRVESVLRRTSGRAPELADVLADGDLVIDHPHRNQPAQHEADAGNRHRQRVGRPVGDRENPEPDAGHPAGERRVLAIAEQKLLPPGIGLGDVHVDVLCALQRSEDDGPQQRMGEGEDDDEPEAGALIMGQRGDPCGEPSRHRDMTQPRLLAGLQAGAGFGADCGCV